jgi:hypothetical protein
MTRALLKMSQGKKPDNDIKDLQMCLCGEIPNEDATCLCKNIGIFPSCQSHYTRNCGVYQSWSLLLEKARLCELWWTLNMKNGSPCIYSTCRSQFNYKFKNNQSWIRWGWTLELSWTSWRRLKCLLMFFCFLWFWQLFCTKNWGK